MSEPNIRVKRYATRSRRSRRASSRRRGGIATLVLVALIVLVAALALAVGLSPPKKPATQEPAAKGPAPSAAPAVVEATTTAQSEPSATVSATGARPESISSIFVKPKIITPSALPNCTGDAGLDPLATVTLEMSKPATVAVAVVDPEGAVVSRIFAGRLEEGSQTYEWDGKYRNGDPVASGDYSVRAQVLSSASPSETGASIDAPLQAVQFVMRGPKNRKAVALTIDDGWNPDMRIVDYLKKNKIPATAFLIGGRGVVDENPDFVRTLTKAGMEISNHTYDHAWLTEMTPRDVRADIAKAQTNITKITKSNNHWVRASGGSIGTTVLRAGRKDGYHFVQWSIDSGDASGGTDVEGTLNNVTNGDILLCHFGGNGTYDWLTQVVPELLRRGFQFKTVSDLMRGMRIDQRTDVPPAAAVVRPLETPPGAPISPML